jgi:replicative DNA helicase
MKDLKTPPNNLEAEKAVLGSILLDTRNKNEDCILDLCLSQQIEQDSFFDPRNKIIFAAMQNLAKLSMPLDAITLVEELRNTNKLEAIGGITYIESLFDQVATTAHAEHYITILRGKHLRRRMIANSEKVIAKCFDEEKNPDVGAVLGEAEKSFLDIQGNNSVALEWGDAVQASFENIDKMFSSDGHSLQGLPTGLTLLDERLQGLKKAEMIVIAARPSVGKTSLAMNIAECCAVAENLSGEPFRGEHCRPHPVLIFSLEMPTEALSKRMIAGRAGINVWRLNRALYPSSIRNELTSNLFRAADDLKKAPIFVDDTAYLDVADMRARARRWKRSQNIELIVIDYLQLLHCAEGARQSRVIEVSMISQQIKAMAKELNIPVIVLSQLSRANEQRNDKTEKPKLSDLRDSGAIEQDADVVLLLRRPSRSPKDPEASDTKLAIIDVAKNRNGETGEVRVDFNGEFTRFGNRPLEKTDSPPPPPPVQEQFYARIKPGTEEDDAYAD